MQICEYLSKLDCKESAIWASQGTGPSTATSHGCGVPAVYDTANSTARAAIMNFIVRARLFKHDF